MLFIRIELPSHAQNHSSSNGFITLLSRQDIKPGNLFISKDKLIKLGDFGLATQLNHTCSKRRTECGTPLYIAPEMYYGKTELNSDVWSLGITLMELAEGWNPFADCSSQKVMKMVLYEQLPSLSFSKWSMEFVDFVNKCLVRDVNERWSVDQLMNVTLDILNKK